VRIAGAIRTNQPFDIRVNAINPVAGKTPLFATFMGHDAP